MAPVELHPAEAEELNLLYDWGSLYPPQVDKAAIGAMIFHGLLLVLIILLPPAKVRVHPVDEIRIDVSKSTPLIAPVPPRPFELTQKAPNRGQVSKEVNLEALLPKPEQVAKNTPPPRRYTPPPAPSAKPTQQALVPEPTPPQLGNSQLQLPQITVPQLPANEKPKIAFENPGSPAGSPTGSPKGIIPRAPSPSVDEAVRASIRNRSAGGLVVADVMDLPSGADATLSATPKKGQAGSSLELLSDPQGVDFKPYLIRVLAAVRRNWFAVIPESVKFGQRGKTVIQFAISQNGGVPKLVISLPSGTESLDRAAVAGISASNPFPPLPAEFKGEFIRLQLSFMYNMPVN